MLSAHILRSVHHSQGCDSSNKQPASPTNSLFRSILCMATGVTCFDILDHRRIFYQCLSFFSGDGLLLHAGNSIEYDNHSI